MSDAADRVLAVLATEVQSAIILDTGDVRAVCLRVKELEADIAIFTDVAFSKRDRCRVLEAELQVQVDLTARWMGKAVDATTRANKAQAELDRLWEEAKG